MIRGSIQAYSVWTTKLYRRGRLHLVDHGHNVTTTQMLNHIANVVFHGTTPITTWYVGLFGSNTTPTADCTYAVPVFTEFTAYDEATRPVFTEGAASGGVLSNVANPARFTFNSDTTVYGGMLVGGGSAPSTKGNTAGGGILACAKKYDITWQVDATDYMDVVVEFTFAGA